MARTRQGGLVTVFATVAIVAVITAARVVAIATVAFAVRSAIVATVAATRVAPITATRAAAITARTAKVGARPALLARASLAHVEFFFLKFLAIQGLNGSVGLIVVGHLHEAKATRATGLAVCDDMGGFHIAIIGEKFFKALLLSAKVDV